MGNLSNLNGLIIASFMVVLVASFGLSQSVYAQVQAGGVDHDGSWYVGENMKIGDYFSYSLCYVNYRECTEFELDFWIEDTIIHEDESEEKWLVQTVAYDGNKVVKGYMELAKIAPEPTGGSDNIAPYRGAFKSSIAWLSAFTNAEDPKQFSSPSWGKIANIGGEQIVPKEILPAGLTVRAGHFDEVIRIGWRTGGYDSNVYVVDEFPFPIKASTWVHVSEGIPPQEYRFELLDYQENVAENPFTDVVDTGEQLVSKGCPNHNSLETSIKKATVGFDYVTHIFYGPELPVENCPLKMQIKFISKYDDTAFLTQTKYDILVLDDDGKDVRSIAQDEGKPFLYSPSGQSTLEFIVREPPGTANYAVLIYGQAPEHIVPSTIPDYAQIEIPISASKDAPTASVPSWIKTSAGFWVSGATTDAEFIDAVEFLINEGIIVVSDVKSTDQQDAAVPSWIKTTTGFWVDGVTSDSEFISALEFLIREGIVSVS